MQRNPKQMAAIEESYRDKEKLVKEPKLNTPALKGVPKIKMPAVAGVPAAPRFRRRSFYGEKWS